MGPPTAIVDWMLVKRVTRIASDLDEATSPAWDDRFARLLAPVVALSAFATAC